MKKKDYCCDRCGAIVGVKDDGMPRITFLRVQQPVMAPVNEAKRSKPNYSMRQKACYRLCERCYDGMKDLLEQYTQV